MPTALPVDADFEGGSPRLSQAYQGAWLAVRLLDERHGRDALLRFYRAVGARRGVPPDTAVEDALAEGMYGTSPTESFWWLIARAPHSGTTLDLVFTIGIAAVVIGLCLALGTVLNRGWSLALLPATGAGAATGALDQIDPAAGAAAATGTGSDDSDAALCCVRG